MAYDQELADRIRLIIGADPDRLSGLTEKKMFGGLAFLIGGNMAISASKEGGILVRVDPADSQQLTETTGATVAVMGGRAMTGWLRVAAAAVDDDEDLVPWVERSCAFARSLPAKH
ncbi:MAG: TfoX/Sxy family protein [Actinobacteria bacterium]|nr:TfoX/Sxy family protein [Actinomycetota bacterium]